MSNTLFPESVTGNGGLAAALALEALDIECVFTIPSAHNLAILKAIGQRGRIRVVGCRHEQGVVHAADGYARTTGRLAVGIVSTGPGTANAMGGMYEAHHASSPILLITTQVETRYLGRGFGYVHEADNQAAMLRTVCGDVRTIERADEIAETIVQLGRTAVRGRPRPVAVEIPSDLLEQAGLEIAAAALQQDAAAPVPRTRPVTETIDEAAAVLATARRPLIWAGGGVIRSGAAAALSRLAEKWNAPILTSREGRGAVPEDGERSLGAVATTREMRAFIAQCDVLLAVGTRFQQYPTGEWTVPFPSRLVHLDIDPTVIGRSYPTEVALVGDAEIGLEMLTKALPPLSIGEADTRTVHLELGRSAAAAMREEKGLEAGRDQRAICESINRRRPRDGVVVRDATVPAYVWGESLLKIWEPRTSIRSTAAGIGPGLPLGIGAGLASRKHAIVLQGDGGFMLSLGELATAVQAAAPVVICLFNDRGYQMLRNIESRTGDGELHDVDLVTPRFADLATSFGARSTHVTSAAAFDTALAEALTVQGPTLIEIDMLSLEPMCP
ncbi:acetolactate synthase-1/2/3 large subunit [Rhodococcus sp. OK519]|uniref:thiamine pyrophosphate-binding protein n=1 Tax=Rhodococcus sp. OK519 TaxID=2135729 RepID=UPI000D35AC10|nr:acetolactate synthase-1/2/3 large subunit [Rhodococcus sp. OK519]